MIRKLDITRLHLEETLQFFEDFGKVIENIDPAQLAIIQEYNDFKTQFEKISGLYKKNEKSELTSEVSKLDEMRDKAIVGMRAVIQGLTKHFDDNVAQAAQILLHSIDRYGTNISSLNLQAETTVISNIIDDWENKAELKQAIQTIGYDNWRDYLKSTNEEFKKVYISRVEERGDNDDSNMAEERKLNVKLYHEVRDRIDAFSIIYKNNANRLAIYDKATNRINALIEKYELILSGRNTTNKNEEKPTDE